MATITTVLVFANGMVAVCDEHGKQMPEYQGRWIDKQSAILRNKPDSVMVQHQ